MSLSKGKAFTLTDSFTLGKEATTWFLQYVSLCNSSAGLQADLSFGYVHASFTWKVIYSFWHQGGKLFIIVYE